MTSVCKWAYLVHMKHPFCRTETATDVLPSFGVEAMQQSECSTLQHNAYFSKCEVVAAARTTAISFSQFRLGDMVKKHGTSNDDPLRRCVGTANWGAKVRTYRL